MIAPDTLDRLESQATRQIGKEMSTPIAVNPGDLRALIACYRQHGLPPSNEEETAA